jgi:hypothetical protein
MNGKFKHKMLVDILAAKVGKCFTEGQKVMNQIHDYMDMHSNRFGYIITETEVVMCRRRDEDQKWGQMDFSPSLKLSPGVGEVSALMALWYFHVKYAALKLDGGWELPSFYHNCPEKLAGPDYLTLQNHEGRKGRVPAGSTMATSKPRASWFHFAGLITWGKISESRQGG